MILEEMLGFLERQHGIKIISSHYKLPQQYQISAEIQYESFKEIDGPEDVRMDLSPQFAPSY